MNSRGKGEVVPPNEVRAILSSHAEVSAAAVCDVPDGLLGQQRLALVKLVDRPSADGSITTEIAAWCASRIPRDACPDRIEAVDELPRLPTGEAAGRCPVVAVDMERDETMRRNHLEGLRGMNRHGPMFFSPFGGYGKGMYVVTGYELFREVTRVPELFSNRYTNLATPTPPPLRRPLVPQQLDPPEHTRYRKLLSRWFSPGAVAALEPRIRAVCAAIVDDVAQRDEIDFAAGVARRIPGSILLQVFCAPLDRLRELTDTTWEMSHLDEQTDPGGSRRAKAAEELVEFIVALVAARRAEPRDDVTTELIASSIDGRPLTDNEVVDLMFLLTLAGLDAVAALLIYSMHYLAEHPADRNRLSTDPDIMPSAVEELLRCFASAPVSRAATTSTRVGGCPVDADDRFYLNVVMANHDKSAFDDPDEFRIDRTPNRHVAFGSGVHHCLGSNLARTEIRIFLEEWHKRIQDYRITEGAVIVDSPLGVAAFESLPLTVGPRA